MIFMQCSLLKRKMYKRRKSIDILKAYAIQGDYSYKHVYMHVVTKLYTSCDVATSLHINL